MYTMENMQGRTQGEVDALNAELQALLADAACSTDDSLSADEVVEIIQQHADDVARR